MKSSTSSHLKSLVLRGAVAAAAVAACSAASAVSSFTFDPSKITGVSSGIVTADTLSALDYGVVTTTGSSFAETGYLAINGFSLAGKSEADATTGLNSSYGIYVSFDATGTAGNLTSLDYSVYGYSGGAATFGATATGVTKSATPNQTLLANGTLGAGANIYFGAALPIPPFTVLAAGVFGNALTFSNLAGAFSPVTSASVEIGNTQEQITTTSTGFFANGGSATINLVTTPVPEPETYALMLGGLGALGFVARRRNNV